MSKQMGIEVTRSNHPGWPWLLALCAAALFGIATPASKLMLETLSPFVLAGLLYLGASLSVLPAAAGGGLARPWRLDARNLKLLLGAISFGGILGPVFLLFGLKAASAASVSLWLNLELVATAILGAFFFRDPLGRLGWAAAAGVMLAATILAWAEKAAGFHAASLIAMACLCWGADNHVTALMDGLTPTQSTFWKGLAAGTVNLAIGLGMGPIPASFPQVFIALGVGAVSYGASIVLYIHAAQRLGAVRSQLVFSSAPFFGLVFSALIFREYVSVPQSTAAVLMASSLFLLAWERHHHAHMHKAGAHEHAHRHDDSHHGHEHADVPGSQMHSHRHAHEPAKHSHRHWPDLHHRHAHD